MAIRPAVRLRPGSLAACPATASSVLESCAAMSLDQWINLLVPVTLIEMMLVIGMSVRHSEVLAVAQKGGLVIRAALANYVLVPAATVGLLLLFRANAMTSAGFLILAVCPGAPYGPPAVAIAKGNVSVAVGLMVLLAGSSAIVAPPLLQALLPMVAGVAPGSLSLGKMAMTLLITQLVPLCAGLGIRHWLARAADRLLKPAKALSALLNLTIVVLILIAQYQTLWSIRTRGLIGMLTLLMVSLAIGFMLGRGEDRKAMTLSTAIRNVGVGLVIATSAFAGSAALTAVLVYGLLQVIGTMLLAGLWARVTARRPVREAAPV